MYYWGHHVYVVLTGLCVATLFCTFHRIFPGSLKRVQVPGSPNNAAGSDFASMAKPLPKSSRVSVLQTLKRYPNIITHKHTLISFE